MNFLKKALNNVSSEIKVLQQKGKEVIQKIEEKVQSTIETTKTKAHDRQLKLQPIALIADRIYWMNFPSPETIVKISKLLKDKFHDSYYIWNISEHKYEVLLFNEQVADHNTPGYPSPGMKDMLMICKSIMCWLQSDSRNVAIIHCQGTGGRSALIMSFLLCLNSTFELPQQALSHFIEATQRADTKILFPSQQLYLEYFSSLLQGKQVTKKRFFLITMQQFLNRKELILKKIVFSEVPQITRKNEKGEKEASFRPYLQVFKESQIVFNSLNHGRVASYSQSDLSLWFDLDGVDVKDDILFRCKHYHSNALRYPVFRFMIHTGFAKDNVLRLFKKDIDFTANAEVSDNFFIDVIFEEISVEKQQNTQENNLQREDDLNYIVEECKKIGNEARNKDTQSKDINVKIEDMKIGNDNENSVEEEKQQEIKESNEKNMENDISQQKKGIEISKEEIKDLIFSNNNNSIPALLDEANRELEEQKADEEQLNNEETQKEHSKASQLLLETINQDHELDNQEIDDYLENLEKSDDEA